MQVIAHSRLIKRRALWGRLANLAGISLLVGGFVLSLQGQDYIWFSYGALILALLLLNVSKAYTMKFGGRPRVDEGITNSLKALDQKHQLYHYVEGVPVDHLLVTPHGLYVFEGRPQFGRIEVRGEKWKRAGSLRWLMMFSEGGLGNPARDLRQGIEATRRFLAERVGDEAAAEIPIDGAVVFTSPRVVLDVQDATVPVVPARELRPVVRRPDGRQKLTPEQFRRVQEAFGEQARAGALVAAKA